MHAARGEVGQGARANTRNLIYTAHSVVSAVFLGSVVSVLK